MEMIMSTDDAWMLIVNAFLFYLAYKAGQFSIILKLGSKEKTLLIDEVETKKIVRRPVITVEEINGVLYAYDGNDFLAQGKSPDDLGKSIAQRFPNKYHLAKVEIKA